MDLVEFLLARVAEDEETARAALRKSSYGWSDNAFTEALELAEGEGAVKVATAHIARWDPEHVLAECEAKRRILGWHFRALPYERLALFKVLALPYGDHPDCRDEWKPYA